MMGRSDCAPLYACERSHACLPPVVLSCPCIAVRLLQCRPVRAIDGRRADVRACRPARQHAQRMRLERALCARRTEGRQRGATAGDRHGAPGGLATAARLDPGHARQRGARLYGVGARPRRAAIVAQHRTARHGALPGRRLRAHGLAPRRPCQGSERGRPAPPGHAGAGNRQRRLRRQPAGRPVSIRHGAPRAP